MKTNVSAIALALLAAAQPVLAQSPLMRSDEIEMKRTAALAHVQRLSISARAQFDPRVAVSAPGEKGCTFNIGDVDAAKADDALGPQAAGRERRGLRRNQYITVVAATPICVQR